MFILKKTIFKGSGVAIITPMNEDGSINFEEMGKLIDFHLSNNTDAIIVCGTTGESATLTSEEHSNLIKFTVERVNKRIPVIAGTGSNNTNHAIELSKQAEKLGADALLVVTPYYNKTSQTGLVKHYFAIADEVNIPIILYNVPSRTGCNIKAETYVELAKHKNIVAVKEASGNISAVAEIAAKCGDSLDIYSGNDDQIVPILSLGGVGVISVLANVFPKETHEIVDEFLNRDKNKSKELQLYYLELINALFSDVNPIPVKAAMNIKGFECGRCRLPLDDMSKDGFENLKKVMEKYGIKNTK